MTSKTKAMNFATLCKENGWTGSFETDEENDYAKIIAKRKDEELEIEWVNNQLAAPPKYRFAGTEANLHSAAVAKRHVTGLPDMRVAQMRRRRQMRQERAKTVSDFDKATAKKFVDRAIKAGKLFPETACESCGELEQFGEIRTLRAHHHAGYAPENRLNVTWLCEKCHKAAHKAQQNSSNGAEVALEVKQFELPFDVLESPNREVLLACRGNRVVYLNRITHMAEMVYIPKEKNRNWNKLHPVYYMTTASSGRRIINFIEDSGMFRAIALDTILQVR